VTPGGPEPVPITLPVPRKEGAVPLPDGRRLAYAEYGLPSSPPVLYFHGLPSSRLEGALADAEARRIGLRILSLDRPGMGNSSFQPRRGIADWPKDVERFADDLGLARFGVLGTSGGGPYALACAATLPGRVTAAALLAGLGRLADTSRVVQLTGFSRFFLGLARRAPWSLPALCVPVAFSLRTRAPDLYLRRFAFRLCELDREALLDPLVLGAMVGAFRESAAAGHRGPCHDLRIACQPWGFDPASISSPVHLLHGDKDTVVPPAMSEELAGIIPGAKLDILPGEGHYSLPVRHAGRALQFLAESF
jgi:pimeloyl-ACP methyl ester carboxylesterase